MLAALRERAPDVPVRLGEWDKTLFDSVDLVAISPGLNINTPAVAAARAHRVPFVGDIELFARELPSSQRVIAITGSNGKSTVTALTGALCAAAGMRTVVAGNIGVPVLDALTAGRTGRPAAGCLRARALQLPARNHEQPRAHGRRGAQPLAQSSRLASGRGRLCARQVADFSERRRASPEPRRSADHGDAVGSRRAHLRRRCPGRRAPVGFAPAAAANGWRMATWIWSRPVH